MLKVQPSTLWWLTEATKVSVLPPEKMGAAFENGCVDILIHQIVTIMKLKLQKSVFVPACLVATALTGYAGFRLADSDTSLHSASLASETRDSKSSTDSEKETSRKAPAITRLNDAAPHSGTSEKKAWELIDSGDFKQFVSNLRATGCPEQTVRDIVVAELREEFNQRRTAALNREPIPYWEGGYGVDEDQLPELGSISAQEYEMATDLLGKEGSRGLSQPTIEEIAGVRLGAELAGKQQIVESLAERMSDQLSTLMDTPLGVEAPTDQNDRFNAVTQEFEAALAQVLTPQERQAYDLRHSTTAASVRESLRESGVSVNEAEFHELYTARRQFDDRCQPSSTDTIDMTGAWNEYLATSQRILGEDRSAKMNPTSAGLADSN